MILKARAEYTALLRKPRASGDDPGNSGVPEFLEV